MIIRWFLYVLQHFQSAMFSGTKSIQFYLKRINLNLATFYDMACTYSGNPEMKYPVRDAKRLMLCLSDNVKNTKLELKTHLLKQQ